MARLSSLRTGGSFKSTLSGRSTPRNSPTFRRLHSSRTPRRDARNSAGALWFRSNRLVFWLLLITLWAYLGFYIQSKWAHGENDRSFLGYRNKPGPDSDQAANEVSLALTNGSNELVGGRDGMMNLKNMTVVLAQKGGLSSRQDVPPKRSKRSERGMRSKLRGRKITTRGVRSSNMEEQEEEIPKTNTSFGLLFGPFGSTEEQILGWSATKRSGTCDRKGDFARLVWSRKFVLIFHELSMTGAPLSMMELATELLSCGATVSAVVLSKKGGLMSELARRRIKVLDDKANLSFKTAMKADLVIAGSAVCASWIEQYLAHSTASASNQLAWWIMENRREYYDRSKVFLNRVKMLVFLSEAQSNQWLSWCEKENIKLHSQLAIVPLSVNDELAFVAGIPCSLNTPSFSTEKMLEKRQLLRNSVRKEMGLTDNDVLVMTLSSINPAKGQHLLLKSVQLLIDQNTSRHETSMLTAGNSTNSVTVDDSWTVRKLNEETQEGRLKMLIGSVGSKSNKVAYVKGILRFLSNHSNLSKSVLWTRATTNVASLYSAADIYVINSQGMGETFGRVTIEAMAFGLPVLGTDAGGTKEIVEHNITGLLHPAGRVGTEVLSQNLQFLLKNPSTRKQMGTRGRKKVEKMYLKQHMYKKFAQVLFKCMRIK